MRIRYVHYEYVDEVMTLTLAEGPGESGWLVHFMRPTWEDDSDTHSVVNQQHVSVENAVDTWAVRSGELLIAFHENAAAELGYARSLSLGLDVTSAEQDELGTRLDEILVNAVRRPA